MRNERTLKELIERARKHNKKSLTENLYGLLIT